MRPCMISFDVSSLLIVQLRRVLILSFVRFPHIIYIIYAVLLSASFELYSLRLCQYVKDLLSIKNEKLTN